MDSTEEVRDVFWLFSKQNQDWFTLYKIHETIKHDIDIELKPKKIIDNWCGMDKHSSFCHTADYHRHAKFGKYKNKQSPPSPMTIGEAEDFIRLTLLKWMEWRNIVKIET